jgi:hypothetical protein
VDFEGQYAMPWQLQERRNVPLLGIGLQIEVLATTQLLNAKALKHLGQLPGWGLAVEPQ